MGTGTRTGGPVQLVLAVLTGFGVLMAVTGGVLASLSITMQGMALAGFGVAGLVLMTVPRPLPGTLVAGAVVLVLTVAESLRAGTFQLSPWTPLGLLAGTGLLAMAIRTLPRSPMAAPAVPATPAGPAPRVDPDGAVVLVVVILLAMFGYAALLVNGVPPGQLPGFLAATAMPLLAAAVAGATAVLAARRGGVAGLAAAGGLTLAWAGLEIADAAAGVWWQQRTRTGYDVSKATTFGDRADVTPYGNNAITVEVVSQPANAVAVATGPVEGQAVATVLIVLGLALVIAGWWWAAHRRGGILRRSSRPI
jgi:hypothetical protein